MFGDTGPRGQNRPSTAQGASFHHRSNTTFAVALLTPLTVVLIESVDVILKSLCFICHLHLRFVLFLNNPSHSGN